MQKGCCPADTLKSTSAYTSNRISEPPSYDNTPHNDNPTIIPFDHDEIIIKDIDDITKDKVVEDISGHIHNLHTDIEPLYQIYIYVN